MTKEARNVALLVAEEAFELAVRTALHVSSSGSCPFCEGSSESEKDRFVHQKKCPVAVFLRAKHTATPKDGDKVVPGAPYRYPTSYAKRYDVVPKEMRIGRRTVSSYRVLEKDFPVLKDVQAQMADVVMHGYPFASARDAAVEAAVRLSRVVDDKMSTLSRYGGYERLRKVTLAYVAYAIHCGDWGIVERPRSKDLEDALRTDGASLILKKVASGKRRWVE